MIFYLMPTKNLYIFLDLFISFKMLLNLFYVMKIFIFIYNMSEKALIHHDVDIK